MSQDLVSFECNGETYHGYLARANTGTAPGLVLLQEWWGLVPHIKDLADRFAAAGFNTIAPDLYKGETTTEPEEAGKLMMALNIAETEKVLRCVVDLLREDPVTETEKIGVIGFCMGGQLSLYAACTNKKISACVDFYGIHPNVLPPLEQLSAPLLGIFAERDNYASPEAVQKLHVDLERLGKRHTFKTYVADHAFFNDDRPEVYNAVAAEDAWQTTLSFLKQELGE
jgi:carboxymethylenebutenolidase